MTTRPDNVKDKMDKFKSLEFGTSGLRDKVTAMTDMECYINTRGFIMFLEERGDIDSLNKDIALGGDLRSSTPRI
ncbi:MAG: phosphomannomutase, partial [Candidatus Scalindua sp.]|nr:phosphomannomutase [Candidatus Scalindua sp.]